MLNIKKIIEEDKYEKENINKILENQEKISRQIENVNKTSETNFTKLSKQIKNIKQNSEQFLDTKISDIPKTRFLRNPIQWLKEKLGFNNVLKYVAIMHYENTDNGVKQYKVEILNNKYQTLKELPKFKCYENSKSVIISNFENESNYLFDTNSLAMPVVDKKLINAKKRGKKY
ncbi:hypothetical protein [Lactobacillus sp. ESL0677]|uniref:hypothetical protein n=1 Tax=Lactobacillus sp. ESL0677 TaxID=2983208 RepID=UPI0023F95796|nr:hypothetical protein [Lactobacillus sp. ESL0677]WEV36847.1 hypothetical protein OZX76_08930 [Lactobacillus sp. ESL0677]